MIKTNLQIISKEKNIPSTAMFKSWVKAALQEKKSAAEITIRVVDEDESQALNAKYRKKDSSTNVLAFPAEIPPEINIPILGDIIICAPIVNKEAIEQNKTFNAHWAHLTIHGILHLLGYKHDKTKNTEKMEKQEIGILQQLGLPDPYN